MALESDPPPDGQPVNLIDRIAWQWYLVTAAVPIVGAVVGFIAGIVFMAQSKIGPALALWGTSFLAAVVWAAIGWAVLFTWAWDEATNATNVPGFTEPVENSSEPQDSPADEEVLSDASGNESSDADQQSSAIGPRGTKACGNLTVTAESTTCEFANNVFYEYWTATDGGTSHADQISAYSDGLGKWLEVACVVEDMPAGGGAVSCETDAGAQVWIPYRALADYTQEAADEYAASHRVNE